MATARIDSGFIATWPSTGRLRAAVLGWWEDVAWHGSGAFHVLAVHIPGDVAALAWTRAALDDLGQPAGYDLHLDVALVEVRRHLLERGLGIDSVTLVGRPEAALAGLPPPPVHPDLVVAPMDAGHVPAIMQLFETLFREAPEFCWFGAHPTWLQRHKERLTTQANGPDPPPGCHEVLLRDGELVGFWEADFQLENPQWGRKAGVGIILHPSCQRRGLARLAYHRLLLAMVQGGIEIFKGGTSQPAVMHLGRLMGRRPYNVWLRNADRLLFRPDHFDPILEK